VPDVEDADMQIALRVRHATDLDIEELARLRWQSTIEEGDVAEPLASFTERFRPVAHAMLQSETWIIWVLSDSEKLVGTVYVQEVAKVPRPDGRSGSYGYVTAVFLDPTIRNQGLGSRLLQAAIDAARSRGIEFLIVWPSERSVSFYERLGFTLSADAMELPLGTHAGSHLSP
jgi:GNAT superfamily N-acetyltransferase